MKVFPYQKDLRGDYFPIIEIFVKNKTYSIKLLTLLDSGATTSVFSSEAAEELDLDIEKGKEIFLHGVGGKIKGYMHNLTLEIAGKKVVAPVVFSEEYLVSFNLLGRSGIFKQFKITFEEKHLRVKFE